MNHPVVENMMRTGFVDGRIPKQEIICEQCGDELGKHIEFDGMTFCGSDCLGKFLIDCGEAKRIA